MKVRVTGGFNPWFGPAPSYDGETGLVPRTIAILGDDTPGIRAVFEQEEGAMVAAGDPLFTDRRRPELRHVAPAAGIITEISRGPRRSLDRLVITLDIDSKAPRTFMVPDRLDRNALVALMIEAGLWIGLRTRPFGRIPAPADQPEALFITAIDTRPLAPDPSAVITPRRLWFGRGLSALRLLTSGKTYLCHGEGAVMPSVDGVVPARFAGPHPAGLAGTHIHHLHPVGARGTVWHLGYEEVIALGHLLETGTIWQRRVVGLAGDGVRQAVLLETVPGADLHELFSGRLVEAPVRLLSGSPVDGRVGRYLARGHQQASALRHAPVPERSTGLRHAADWLMRGSGAVIPNRLHESAAPPFLLPVPFLRAISVGDTETARRLGALELIEEDLALLAYADGGKADFGRMLRNVLDALEAER